MISRFKALPSRTKVFIVLGLVLVVLAGSGRLTSRGDVNIESDEAIAIGRPLIDFEPTIEEAKLIRQGFSRRPVWAVAFAIPDPDGGRDDYINRVTIEIDAGDGEIIGVNVEDAPAGSG